jgi:hypothetical protein
MYCREMIDVLCVEEMQLTLMKPQFYMYECFMVDFFCK